MARRCMIGDCPLFKAREIPYSGNTRANIVVIGESPKGPELRRSEQFVGYDGQLLKKTMRTVGLVWGDMFHMNAARCLIDKKNLSAKEVTAILVKCRVKLAAAINLIKPKLILCAGDFAMRQILKHGGITKSRGQIVYSEEFKCHVLPIFHPAYILRNMAMEKMLIEDLRMAKGFQDNGFEMPKETGYTYSEVQDISDILAMPKALIGLDTEGQGLDWTNPDYVMISYSVSWAKGGGYNIRMWEECSIEEASAAPMGRVFMWMRKADNSNKKVERVVGIKPVQNFEIKIKQLKQLLESEVHLKYMMNGNFDIHVFNRFFGQQNMTYTLRGYRMDIQAAAQLLDENVFKQSTLVMLQQCMTDFREDYDGQMSKDYDKGDMLAVPHAVMTKYAAADSDVTRRAAMHIRTELSKTEHRRLAIYYSKFVQPTLNLLMVMEENGCYIDAEALPETQIEVAALEFAELRSCLKLVPAPVARKHAGKCKLTRREFLSDILFSEEGFHMKPVKSTKTGYSVDKEVRQTLMEGRICMDALSFLTHYGEWQELNTLSTRYLKGFAKHIKFDGRIHTKYSIAKIVTGRIASSDPNMMNNPKRSKSAPKIRRLIAAAPGHLLIAADQGQCLPETAELTTVDGVRTLREVMDGAIPVLSVSNDWVPSFQNVDNAWCTGEKECVKITYADGSTEVCSLLHGFRKWDGDWVHAEDMRPGDKMAHTWLTNVDTDKSYPQIGIARKDNWTEGAVKWRMHQLVGDFLSGGSVPEGSEVHHDDLDKRNWHRSNLLILRSAEHKSIHSAGSRNNNYGNRKGGTKTCPVCSTPFYRPPSRAHEKTCSRSCSNRLYPRNQHISVGGNHRVVSIEHVGMLKTYQIEVALNHTYVMSNGIISKNSELRWAAHVTNDPGMIQVFRMKQDIHTATAMDLTVKEWVTLTKDEIKLARRNAKCFHPDTEFLTECGWKHCADLQKGEKIYQAVPSNTKGMLLELVPPILMESRPNHCDTLFHLSNEGIDQRVTPDHRMLGQRETGEFFVTTPQEFNKVRTWHNAGSGISEHLTIDHKILRLVVATQADGSFQGRLSIRFGFTKQRKISRFRSLVEGECVHDRGWSSGTQEFTISGYLVDQVKEWLTDDKVFDVRLAQMDSDCRKVFLEEVVHWDSHKAEHWRAFKYTSKDRNNCEVVQHIATLEGLKTRLTQEPKYGYWHLTIRDKGTSRGGNVNIKEFPYTGDVIVCSVPSTFVIVRDGGIPVITGQSVNFGLLFGMSRNGFIKYAKIEYGIDLTEDEATAWIAIFFGKYKMLQVYHRKIAAICARQGYVESPLGRRRRLPEINSSDIGLKSSAERQAINHPIQSPSSDITLMAGSQMLEKGLLPPEEIRPILFIHDELVFEVLETADVMGYCKMIKHEMENPPLERDFGVKLKVPLLAEVSLGPNLAEMEELDL